jgi:DNA-binding winged helix-turn-helix (wHTH) protein
VIYTIGAIRVDAEARDVSSRSGPVHLRRQALDLLLLLLEDRPRAVSKDRIHERLWPGTFVSEASLQSLVHELRRALDDRTAPVSCIATVHGIGYRYAGPVAIEDAPRIAPPRPAAWLTGGDVRIPLIAGETIIGRGVDGVVDIDAPTISRRHARIVIGTSMTSEDLGSRNGTWIGGERVTQPRPLADGDTVRFGSVARTFRLAGEPRPTEADSGVPEDDGRTP